MFKRLNLLLVLVLLLVAASISQADGGLFGFRNRQRVVIRNNFVQPVVAVNAFHSAAFVQPVVRVRAFHTAAFVQPVYAQQFVQPVYGVQQFSSGCNCGGSAAFGVSPFLRLNFGY